MPPALCPWSLCHQMRHLAGCKWHQGAASLWHGWEGTLPPQVQEQWNGRTVQASTSAESCSNELVVRRVSGHSALHEITAMEDLCQLCAG